jgi:hypothetical protein
MSCGSLDGTDPCGARGFFHLAPSGGGVGGGEASGAAAARTLAGVQAPPSWWPRRFTDFLTSCASCLVERLGAENVRTILLSGSFALNEGSVVFTDDGPIFLSDIDLVVVVPTLDALTAVYRSRSELGAACEALFPEAAFSGRIEIGVLLLSQLPHLAARPGVLDMKRYASVLWGDVASLALVPSFRAEEVPDEEALTLIENRIAAFLGSYPSPGGVETISPAFRYGIARVYTDIATAALCLLGSYRAGYAERGRSILEGAGGPETKRLLEAALAKRIDLWTRFKLDPGAEPAGAEWDGRTPVERWGEAAADLLEFWRRAASFARSAVSDSRTPRSIDSLLRGRGGSARLADRLRFWKWYLARMPLGARVRTVARLRGMLLRRDPLELIREHGVRLVDHWMRRGAAGALESGRYPLVSELRDWYGAAARVHALWVEVVFGRRGTA